MTFTNVDMEYTAAIDNILCKLFKEINFVPEPTIEELNKMLDEFFYEIGEREPHFPMPITLHLADKMVLGDMGLFRAAVNY